MRPYGGTTEVQKGIPQPRFVRRRFTGQFCSREPVRRVGTQSGTVLKTTTKMESVRLALMKRIEEAMPELRIDEECGQLESQQEQYPVACPCVLVAMGDTEWQPVANRPGIQQGKMSVTLKLAIDCHDDTQAGSTTEAKIAGREEMAARLFRAVQGMRLPQGLSALDRRRSREYASGGGIKVYEITFEYLVRESV